MHYMYVHKTKRHSHSGTDILWRIQDWFGKGFIIKAFRENSFASLIQYKLTFPPIFVHNFAEFHSQTTGRATPSINCTNIRTSTSMLWACRLHYSVDLRIQTYTQPVPLKRGKLATKYMWMYGYFYSVPCIGQRWHCTLPAQLNVNRITLSSPVHFI